MKSLPVVEDLDAFGDREPCSVPGRERFLAVHFVLHISFFKVANQNSAAALSRHTPVRPTLVLIAFFLVSSANPVEVY